MKESIYQANYILCANANEDKILGRLDENGELYISNPAIYHKIKTTSTIKNEACKKCKRLPLCIGSCKKVRYQNNSGCMGERLANGLSVDEMAKLDYLYDTIEIDKKEKKIG